jgi:hypothetical protein
MKRLFATVAVLSALLAIPVSHFALADGGGTNEVTVCHVTRSISNHGGRTVSFGHYISISQNALPDHLAHGDLVMDESRRGCCAFCVTQEGESCPVVID